MFNLGPMELLMIFLVALLVFGPEKLPEVARTLAKIMREIRRAGDEVRQHLDPDMDLYKTTYLDALSPKASSPDIIDSIPQSEAGEPARPEPMNPDGDNKPPLAISDE